MATGEPMAASPAAMAASPAAMAASPAAMAASPAAMAASPATMAASSATMAAARLCDGSGNYSEHRDCNSAKESDAAKGRTIRALTHFRDLPGEPVPPRHTHSNKR
jgi:hypothetical protein